MLRSIICIFLLASCSGFEKSEYDKVRRENSHGEYIYRKSDSNVFSIEEPSLRKRDPYPWEDSISSNLAKITKDHFRCRGSYSNPPILEEDKSNEVHSFTDCEGSSKHSLSIIHGKEGVYPVLIDLLNYLQNKLKRKVIITCGYRCPIHNTYVDRSKENRISKHMIGAEVDFYVQNMEDKPQEVIEYIFQFYKERPGYRGEKQFEEFLRYDKDDTNVSTLPWYNKEIFIKLFKSNEGRDLDNRHPYPYISIQVKYDRDLKENVFYTWERARQGYHRF